MDIYTVILTNVTIHIHYYVFMSSRRVLKVLKNPSSCSFATSISMYKHTLFTCCWLPYSHVVALKRPVVINISISMSILAAVLKSIGTRGWIRHNSKPHSNIIISKFPYACRFKMQSTALIFWVPFLVYDLWVVCMFIR